MINRVIKTQKDLDMLRSEEDGMFYICLAGQIAMFNKTYVLTKIQAMEKLAEIANGQSEMIADSIAKGKKEDAFEALEVALQTFMIPYRTH